MIRYVTDKERQVVDPEAIAYYKGQPSIENLAITIPIMAAAALIGMVRRGRRGASKAMSRAATANANICQRLSVARKTRRVARPAKKKIMGRMKRSRIKCR